MDCLYSYQVEPLDDMDQIVPSLNFHLNLGGHNYCQVKKTISTCQRRFLR